MYFANSPLGFSAFTSAPVSDLLHRHFSYTSSALILFLIIILIVIIILYHYCCCSFLSVPCLGFVYFCFAFCLFLFAFICFLSAFRLISIWYLSVFVCFLSVLFAFCLFLFLLSCFVSLFTFCVCLLSVFVSLFFLLSHFMLNNNWRTNCRTNQDQQLQPPITNKALPCNSSSPPPKPYAVHNILS